MSRLDIEEMSCNICDSTFNKSTRKQIKCLYCNYEVCLDCFKKMMIMNGEECPNCSKIWSREFIQSNATKTWFDTTYKEKRKEQLLDREKALLQEAMPIVKARQYKEKMNKEIAEVQKKLAELTETKRRLDFEKTHNYNRILNGFEAVDEVKVDETTKVKTTFIKNCPSNECRGFLSSRWKCDLCEICVCPDCHQVKKAINDDEHKCREDDIKTAELIMKTTKPCPKCGARIHKIEGCNAMFCVYCKTCFNFNTGKITGSNSNPHYAQWMIQNNKQPNNPAIPQNPANAGAFCGMNYQQLVKKINQNIISKKINVPFHLENDAIFANFYHQILHIEQILCPRFRQENDNDKLLNLRVKYLTNEIDEKEWNRQIFIQDKKNEYNKIIHDLFQMVAHVWTDSIINMGKADTKEEFEQLFKDIAKVVEYFNEYSKKTSKEFGYSVYEWIVYNPEARRINLKMALRDAWNQFPRHYPRNDGDQKHIDFVKLSHNQNVKKEKSKEKSKEENKKEE